jgi:two-component system OmpR family response regulator
MSTMRDTGPELRRADGGPIRVLVVDDEASLSELLSMALRYEGWDVRTAADGATAVRIAREQRPDAVVLDVMLPDFDGLEVLRRLRAEAPEVPVLFLTARDAVEDRVAGLTAGGDDLIELTATEFELLRYLMRNPKRVLSKAQILDRVWNYDFGGQSNVVELYVSYLRKKIDAGRAPMIRTVRGAGYVLKAAAGG